MSSLFLFTLLEAIINELTNVRSRVGVIISISEMKKLRPERLGSLPKATQLEVVEWEWELDGIRLSA